MNRDMEYVRELLLKIEQAPDRWLKSRALSESDTDHGHDARLNYHLWLLHDADLLDGLHTMLMDGSEFWDQLKLTWNGQEFLDAVRDPEIWTKTKSGAEKVGNLGLSFLLDLAKSYAKVIAKERLGLDL